MDEIALEGLFFVDLHTNIIHLQNNCSYYFPIAMIIFNLLMLI